MMTSLQKRKNVKNILIIDFLFFCEKGLVVVTLNFWSLYIICMY